jgi:hypothetical protein
MHRELLRKKLSVSCIYFAMKELEFVKIAL